MRNRLVMFSGILILSALATPLGIQAGGGDDSGVHTVEISAKKYEFTPNVIRVKAGERVRLKVHSVDEPHGVKLSLYPEEGKAKASGLKFDSPDTNGKVEKNVDQVLEFIALMPGTYEFKCAKLCGMGHGKMKGKLIVE